MVGTIGLWRILFVFALTSISSMTWFQGLKAIDPSGGANTIAGFASNGGMLLFGSFLLLLAVRRQSIPAQRWQLSLILAVVMNLSQPIWLMFADNHVTVVVYSILLFVTSTLLTSQVTSLTMAESSNFPLDRRGGSLGYGLAYAVASTQVFWWASGLSILCAAALLALPHMAELFDKSRPKEPRRRKRLRVTSNRTKLIVTTMFLFAMLSASSRIYESFSAGLIGTQEGVGGVAVLVVLECFLLPKLDDRHAKRWIFIALAAWPAAYLLLLQDGWLQVVAIACISANCCGQTVLQEQLQVASKPGNSQLQATMSVFAAATAAVVSYVSLGWRATEHGPIWALGLIASTITLCMAIPTLVLSANMFSEGYDLASPHEDADDRS